MTVLSARTFETSIASEHLYHLKKGETINTSHEQQQLLAKLVNRLLQVSTVNCSRKLGMLEDRKVESHDFLIIIHRHDLYCSCRIQMLMLLI